MKRNEFIKLLGLGTIAGLIPIDLSTKSAKQYGHKYGYALVLDSFDNVLFYADSVKYSSIYHHEHLRFAPEYYLIELTGKVEDMGTLQDSCRNNRIVKYMASANITGDEIIEAYCEITKLGEKEIHLKSIIGLTVKYVP